VSKYVLQSSMHIHGNDFLQYYSGYLSYVSVV
jgi:hypothetical protein